MWSYKTAAMSLFSEQVFVSWLPCLLITGILMILKNEVMEEEEEEEKQKTEEGHSILVMTELYLMAKLRYFQLN